MLPAMSEAEKQFYLTRAASMDRRGAKSKFRGQIKSRFVMQ
jgi:hypothetical protein